jgi:hypothetical protein
MGTQGDFLLMEVPVKARRSVSELAGLLTEVLSRHAECADILVDRIRSIETDGGPNWEADLEPRKGKEISPDCRRVALAAIHDLQQRFDLGN